MSRAAGNLLLWMCAWRIAWRLRLRPLEEVARELGRRPIRCRAAEPLDARAIAARVDRIVNRWTVPLAGPCLIRSLLVYSLFRGPGSGLELVLGFAPCGRAEKLRGHAWLQHEDEPLRADDADAPRAYPTMVVLS